MLKRKSVGICCLQKARVRGGSVRMIGGKEIQYKRIRKMKW